MNEQPTRADLPTASGVPAPPSPRDAKTRTSPGSSVERRAARIGLLALTGTGVLWGSIGVVVRLLQNDEMTSASIAFWRFTAAAPILLPLLGRVQLRLIATQLRRPGRLLLVSAASLTFQLLYFLSVRDVGAGVATLIALGLGPIVLHIAEALSARAAPPPRTVVVVLLAMAGLILVTTGDITATVAPHPTRGLVEAVCSGLAYAASTVWTRPLLAKLPPLSITFVTSVVAVALLLPVLAATGWHVPRTGWTAGGVVWLAVGTTVVAYGLFYFGLRTTRASTAMIVTLLEPVTAFVLATVLLGEPMTLHNVVGGSLVLLAVIALYLWPAPRLGDRHELLTRQDRG